MFTTYVKDDEITPALAALLAAMGDLTKPMQDLGEIAVDTTKKRFAEGVSPEGLPWAPKSQATIDSYRRGEGRGANAPIDFRPLFGPSGSLSTQIHYVAGTTSVEWGSSLIYAGVMQRGAAKGAFGAMSNGSSIPWGNIPARPFLGVSESDRGLMLDAIAEWLDDVAD